MDYCARDLLSGGNGRPVFEGVVIEVARGVEDPVAGVGDDGLDGEDGYARGGEEHSRVDYVGVRVGSCGEFGECCAGDCVVEGAGDVDFEALGEDGGV